MARVTLDIEGTREVERLLSRIEDAAQADVLEDALGVGAKMLAEEASVRAPRSRGSGHGPGGGHLADNISWNTKITSRNTANGRAGPLKPYWYGIFPEVGTKQHAANPYLRPAWDARRRLIVATMRSHLAGQVLARTR